MLRKTVLLAHVVASVGLLGAVAAFVLLAVAGFSGTTDVAVRSADWAGGLTTNLLILPLAILALASGILCSLSSPWGVFRHYWVVVKLGLTLLILAVLVLHLNPVSFMAERANSGALAIRDHLAERRQLVIASGAGLLAVLAASVLSIFKPSGLTLYGWRKLRAPRSGGDPEH